MTPKKVYDIVESNISRYVDKMAGGTTRLHSTSDKTAEILEFNFNVNTRSENTKILIQTNKNQN